MWIVDLVWSARALGDAPAETNFRGRGTGHSHCSNEFFGPRRHQAIPMQRTLKVESKLTHVYGVGSVDVVIIEI